MDEFFFMVIKTNQLGVYQDRREGLAVQMLIKICFAITIQHEDFVSLGVSGLSIGFLWGDSGCLLGRG